MHPFPLLLALLACNPDKPADSDTGSETQDTGQPPVDTGDSSEETGQDTGPTDADADGIPASRDCDDTDPSVFPGAPEVCDGRDQDCDGTADEDLLSTWYTDADGDGAGDPALPVLACEAPPASSASGDDCDDTRPEVHPGAPELCDGLDDDCDGSIDEDLLSTWYADTDGDGWGDDATGSLLCEPGPGWAATPGDCDDHNSDLSPDALEVCDSLDNDCDGAVDEEGALGETPWYADGDGDGYGSDEVMALACTAPEGASALPGDCDDTDPAFHPGALEDDCTDPTDWNCDGSTGFTDADADGWAACAECDDTDPAVFPGAEEVCDGVDDDCDGDVDEPDATDAPTWYADADLDGWGDPLSLSRACAAPSGLVADGTDCDDTDPSVHPTAPETCDLADQDCDGAVDEGVLEVYYADADLDGWGSPVVTLEACAPPSGWVLDATDCDDTSPAIHPEATESCDGSDEDCDGAVDEAGALGETAWYADGDGDGWGAGAPLLACAAPSGTVAFDGDCDDGDPAFHPGAPEDDCTDPTDWNCDGSTGWADGDLDGSAACVDCDDTDPATYPGAPETCDGRDQDCDGDVDESGALGETPWYADGDGDGWGAGAPLLACAAPGGAVASDGDCDDTQASVFPGAPETCDGLDQDCDGDVDEGVMDTFYADADGDGWGDGASPREACEAPAGAVPDATDCDDTLPSVFPGAPETCDGRDDDCDGTVDEADATDAPTWYRDQDDDGWGTSTTTRQACDAPSGYVSTAGDCDDRDASESPGADEVCDSQDDDCDGIVDEGVTSTWHADADADGWGDPVARVEACRAPTGYVSDATDCDDTRASVYPRATETCNSLDDDCDGDVDEDSATDAATWYIDHDGDGYGASTYTREACFAPTGYVATATDCDDRREDDHPGATETCDGRDNDCDALLDEADPDVVGLLPFHADADADGWGDASAPIDACDAPTGYVDDATDCDDLDPDIRPDATEVCDGLDNDCDGVADLGALGDEILCAAPDCAAILAEDSSSPDGIYWLDPDGDGDTSDAWEAFCDMTRDGGGWTRLYSSHYPTWWSSDDWEYVGDVADDDYSILGERTLFAEGGVYTFRFEVGNTGTWEDAGRRAHYTVWTQAHDPFTDTTDGSDYVFVSGEASTTCSGFNGLHDKLYASGYNWCMTSDVDTYDGVSCWWMQVVPLTQYSSPTSYPGYLEGYSGPNVHTWHTLWVR